MRPRGIAISSKVPLCPLLLLSVVPVSAVHAQAQQDVWEAESVGTIPVGPQQEQSPPPRRARNAEELETMVVTATKRAVDLRDIAGSVGAVSGEQLEGMGAQSMKDYLKLVPGVIFADQGSDESVPIIRGIATDTGLQFTAPTTGVFMDEMPFTTLLLPLSVPDINPFDMERVEVLKGPQGTLFGGTALNGAIRYITHKPGHDVWEAKLRQTLADTRFGGGHVGGFDSVTSAAVNVPLLGDSLALRGVGVRRRDGGLYDASAEGILGNELRNTPDADRMKQDHGRVMASWRPPLERLHLSAYYFVQDSKRADMVAADNPDKPTIGPDDIGRPFASPRTHKFTGSNLRITYDFGWAELLSATNRFTQDNWIVLHDEVEFALDRQDQLAFFSLGANDLKGFSQELRLNSRQGGTGNWHWVAGFTLFRNKENFWQFTHLGPDIDEPRRKDQVTELQRITSFLFADIDNRATEKAFFGDVSWHPTERWELNAGARAFRIDLDSVSMICGLQTLALSPPDQKPCLEAPGSLSESGVNPKFSLRYLFNRNVQLYALAARGFQFGGFQINPPFIGLSESAEASGHTFGPFRSSVLWNFEGGIRTEWLNRRLRVDVTGFRLNWKDLQLTVDVPIGGDLGRIPQPGIPPQLPPDPDETETVSFTFASIENVGQAHSTGVELSIAAIPVTGAHLISNAAWIKAVTAAPFDEDHPDGPVPAGTTLPGSPRWQWSNAASYQHGLPFFPAWTIALTLTHTRFGTAPDSIRPEGTILGYDSFDARFDLAKADSRFQPVLSVGVNNLFDTRGVTAHSALTRADDGRRVESFVFIPPRTLTLTLSMHFSPGG